MVALWQAQAMASAELAEHGVRYAWVVTHEYEEEWDAASNDYKGRWIALAEGDVVAGPGTATEEEIERAASRGKAFRIDYDGEDGPACKGRMWASDAAHPRDSEACFAPLDDYGRGNYGATSIRYRNTENKWEEL